MLQTRRDVLKLGLMGAGTLALPRWALASSAASAEPHFFIAVIMDQGADFSYMFDARPLAMTAAGKIQNYLGEDPAPWTGKNGGRTLATKLVKPLEAWRDRFSVINGVLMEPTFDGHMQNMNHLFTGNAFGGDSFIPHLNTLGSAKLPIDAIQNGSIIGTTIANGAGIVPLNGDSTKALLSKLKGSAPSRPTDELIAHIRGRMAAAAGGPGRFSQGAGKMIGGLDNSPLLHERLLKVQLPAESETPVRKYAFLLSELFKAQVAPGALWILPQTYDVHAAQQARGQPKLFGDTCAYIAEIFKALNETQFDSKRSMLDVTTVMVTSEFGRTMRQPGSAIDNTGTDHNQFCNSIMLGGKGIKGGLVVGASDFETLNAPISGAHKAKDPELVRLMPKPFDFASETPRTDLPAQFNVDDYLSIGSVVNTIYSMYGIPAAKYRLTRKDGPIAPTLKTLLA